MQHNAAREEAERIAERDQQGAAQQARDSAARRAPAERAHDDYSKIRVTIATTGLARERPDRSSPASWRITAGEQYRIVEERDGWIRLQAEVPAWVEASAIKR